MTTMDWRDPPLSADFAARVLDRADRIRIRQARIQWTMSGVAATTCASLAVAWVVFAGAPQMQHAGPAPLPVARVVPVGEIDEADALVDLFPDAGPVARFAAQYSEETDGTAADVDPFSDDDPASQ